MSGPAIVAVVVASAAGLAAVGWLGLRIPPRPLAPPRAIPAPAGEVDLPAGLPAPVARYYRVLGAGGPRVPRVETFALWGRARMRVIPLLPLPVAFWSEHRVGWSGLQLLAVTWFRLPVLRGRDHYLDGHGEMRIGRRRFAGPEIDQGENLFLWAELVLVPSVVATRPGVRWEPVDGRTARLRVPFGDAEDELTVQFDPATGLAGEIRAMRYREPGSEKLGWRVRYRRWTGSGTGLYPSRIDVTWSDQRRPWFVLDVDGVAAGAAVSGGLAAGALTP